MSRQECERLAGIVSEDVRAKPAEIERVESLLATAMRTRSSSSWADCLIGLRGIAEEIDSRALSLPPMPPGDLGATASWVALLDELHRVEQRWRLLASVQFWTGLLIVPAALGAIVLTGGLLNVPLGVGGSAVAGGVLAAAIVQSFLVLRVHQQARQAEERIVEKRVGLGFLRLAVEHHSRAPEFAPMVKAGTQMFLGHYTAATVPLSSADLPSVPGGKAVLDT